MFMVFHGFSRFQVGFYGFSWFQVDFSWFKVVFFMFFSRFQVGFSWFQVVFMVILGSRSVFPGCRWLFRVFHGPRPLFMISGCFYDFSWFLTFLNDSRLVFMVAIGWLISELSARGVK